MKLASIGQLCLDILVHPTPRDVYAQDATIVSGIQFENGGDALNVAVTACKLGVDVRITGAIGDDLNGEILKKRVLEKAPLDFSGLKKKKGVDTSTVVVMVREDGQRSFLETEGSNYQLSVEDIDFSVIDWADIVTINGTFMLPKLDGAGTKKIFSYAKEKGKITVMDTDFDSTGRWMRTIEEALPYVDYFVPSFDEAKYLAGTEDVEKMGEVLLNAGPKHVIIKLGGEGCYTVTKEERFFTKAFAVDAVDTTGAGDNFVGGLIHAIGMDYSLEQCVRYASAVGAISVSRVGTTTALKNHGQVMEFLSEHGLG